jgi:hypothetical protein
MLTSALRMASRSIGNPSTGNDDAGSDRGERPPNCGSVIRPRRIRPRRNAAGIIRPDAVLHGFRFCNQERGKIVSCSYGMRSGWIGGGSAANSGSLLRLLHSGEPVQAVGTTHVGLRMPRLAHAVAAGAVAGWLGDALEYLWSGPPI